MDRGHDREPAKALARYVQAVLRDVQVYAFFCGGSRASRLRAEAHGVQATNYLHLPVGAKAPDEVNVVVEIPEGSRNKYEYDKELSIFRLDRALHSPVFYPGDYGFIPSTLGEDGDPLDVIILVAQPSFTGCLIVARPIGVLKMVDQGEGDDKILAVPVGEPSYYSVNEHTQIFAHTLREIAHFFETYKLLEDKATQSLGWQDAAAAKNIILESAQRFRDAEAKNVARV
jgi:inorganic pyrophosphatase